MRSINKIFPKSTFFLLVILSFSSTAIFPLSIASRDININNNQEKNKENRTLIESSQEEGDLAIIILSAENMDSVKSAIKKIQSIGGLILHVFPTHVIIGKIPISISHELIGEMYIEQIEYSALNSTYFEHYGETTKIAIEAWNNNFMGQAALEGLVPPPDFPDPPPIRDDVRTEMRSVNETLQASSSPPYGAGFYDTSEYMIGDISVAIILPESNGVIDPNQENWLPGDISDVVSEIQAGLDWWAAREPEAHLTFMYDISVVSSSYEPICRPSSDEDLWIAEAMKIKGYPAGDYFTRVYSYLNDLRNKDGTDWVMAIFVAHSFLDLDGLFTDGDFAYAYLGGPFMVMTYDNSGYNLSNMDVVTAHEFGHIFYALDEYYNAMVPPNTKSGYLNIENQNSEYGGSSNVPCIMRGGVDPYTSNSVCYYTRGQVGWRDSDGDAIFDIIDFEPESVFASCPPDFSSDNTPTYIGTAQSTATYPNRNPYPYCSGNRITINKITGVKYRINGGEWIDALANDGSFDEVIEDFSYTTLPLVTGDYTFQVMALSSSGNVETTYPNDIISIDVTPPNSPFLSESHCGSNWTNHNSPFFTWNNPGDVGGVISYYEGSVNDGSAFKVKSPYHPTWSEGVYTFKVRAIDEFGLKSSWSNIISVKIDTTSPTVLNQIPTGREISITTQISISFNEAMNQTSSQNAFSISPPVSGSFSWIDNTMIFTPSQNLTYGTQYIVTINNGAKDIAGNLLKSTRSWQFKTVKVHDVAIINVEVRSLSSIKNFPLKTIIILITVQNQGNYYDKIKVICNIVDDNNNSYGILRKTSFLVTGRNSIILLTWEIPEGMEKGTYAVISEVLVENDMDLSDNFKIKTFIIE